MTLTLNAYIRNSSDEKLDASAFTEATTKSDPPLCAPFHAASTQPPALSRCPPRSNTTGSAAGLAPAAVLLGAPRDAWAAAMVAGCSATPARVGQSNTAAQMDGTCWMAMDRAMKPRIAKPHAL